MSIKKFPMDRGTETVVPCTFLFVIVSLPIKNHGIQWTENLLTLSRSKLGRLLIRNVDFEEINSLLLYKEYVQIK